jgi:cobalt-zinc-cadmium efflux system membrane fusion protein
LVLPALVEADPARTVAILTPLAGKVTEVLVQLGDKVAAGQALAVVASGDLAQAYADHDKAEDAYRLTRTTLDRTRALVEARGGAPKDLLQAESDNTQALAELTRATERLREIGAGAEVKGRRLLTLRAPIAGTVTTLAAAPGAFVNDPTQVLMTVANLDKVWVTANAPESETAFVTPGMAVDLSFAAYPGRHVAAQVASVGAVLEPDTRRAKVRIALANPEGAFKPNMFANATFSGTPSKGLYVPVSALLMTDDHISVFAEVAPDTYERRIVTVGREAEDQAAITAGLTAGDKVVFRGGVLLND